MKDKDRPILSILLISATTLASLEAVRRIIMGCVSSKNAGVDNTTKSNSHKTSNGVATAAVGRDTTNVGVEQKVGGQMGMVRPKIQVTERDKAMLDLKHQRDLLNQLKKRTALSRDRETNVCFPALYVIFYPLQFINGRLKREMERKFKNYDAIKLTTLLIRPFLFFSHPLCCLIFYRSHKS